MTVQVQGAAAALNPTQREVFDHLLAVGAERPVCSPQLAAHLSAHLEKGTARAVEKWTENRIFLTKATISTALRCEGQLVADADSTRSGTMPSSAAAGIIAHRAIQISSTHPGRSVSEYVNAAVVGAADERGFSELWTQADTGVRSDILNTAVSRTAAFLDSWPVLDPLWTPRFEEPLVARVGKLTLSARADLILGRARADMRQTMFLTDLKTGQLSEHHADEARFYALVATLRHGVAPFRSTVYSLASGEWSDPDITEDILISAADRVIAAANSMVDVMGGTRSPVLSPGRHCSWCPAREVCHASSDSTPSSTFSITSHSPQPGPYFNDGASSDWEPVASAVDY